MFRHARIMLMQYEVAMLERKEGEVLYHARDSAKHTSREAKLYLEGDSFLWEIPSLIRTRSLDPLLTL